MKLIDLANKKFEKLTVIKREKDITERNGKKSVAWLCRCDCGKEIIVRGSSLRKGNTRSCGCICGKHRHTKHNKKERIYNIWSGMKQRCNNPRNQAFKNYGAIGIKVCKEWQESFMNFYNWAMATGYNEMLSIDRINVNGNYEPKNCRWATWKIQQNNRRNNHYIEHNGEKHTVKEWSEILNVAETTIHRRLARGKDIEGKKGGTKDEKKTR